jgi:uncharacterized membrane protein YhaH (DUF805 family)
MAFKYAADAAAIYAVTGHFWSPLDYANPLLSMRGAIAKPAWLLPALAVWTLPFLWIALSMSLRRCLDAGRSPWRTLLIVVPLVNYVVMLQLALAPSRVDSVTPVRARELEVAHGVRSAMLGVFAAVAIALAMVGISVGMFGTYGSALFLATPTVMGAISGFIYNRGQRRSRDSTLIVAVIGVAIAGGGLLLFALEGLLCVAMAFPITAVAAGLGALIGREIASSPRPSAAQALLVVLSLPFLTGVDAVASHSQRFEVVSEIEIDAPPERVWPNVVAVDELPPPSEWLFRMGIAYPLRARIEGSGVGAVRHCEFSTGPFVEPITRWDAPHMLSFDVASQPPPMQEWSPYGAIVTPHLYQYFRSVAGEFRLVALPGGRTRLEGSTWYELDLFPRAYFAWWSDWLVHRIHARVLAHVKELSER